MKKILCYGDSNTWGQAAFGGRIEGEEQWPNILQALLPSSCKVIQEGWAAGLLATLKQNDATETVKAATKLFCEVLARIVLLLLLVQMI